MVVNDEAHTVVNRMSQQRNMTETSTVYTSSPVEVWAWTFVLLARVGDSMEGGEDEVIRVLRTLRRKKSD